MERAEILKRGYLFDKKVGILPKTVDRKRWYVLKRELIGKRGGSVGGVRVVLEIYKDEKAVSKGESPKGLIDICNVVTVQRVATKKQTFEILCPGVGYKLMANSDLEVDEWIQAIKNHITYKRHNSEGGGGGVGVGGEGSGYLPSSSSAPALIPQDPNAGGLRSNSLGRSYPNHPSSHSLHPQQQPHPSHLGMHHPHHHMTHLSPHHHHQPDNRQRTLSDSSPNIGVSGGLLSYQPHPQQHQYYHGQQHPHQTTPIMLPNSQRGMVHITHTLPTPPHSVSPPSFPPYHFSPGTGSSGMVFSRQRSLESAAASSMASPSTSSDSSSMCSGSNASFEGGGAGSSSTGVFEPDGWESKSIFRVQVNEPEHLNLVGPADLTVSDDGLRLLSLPPDQKELVFWPLGCLRKYGNTNHCFTIITGRFCATGEGRFQFFSEESKLIQARLHSFATQKAGRGRGTSRRASEPTDMGTQQIAIPHHPVNPTQSLPPTSLTAYSSSPTSPPYSSDHEYSRLQYMAGHSGGTLPIQSRPGPPTLHPSQSLPVGVHLASHHFAQHCSPTRNHHIPPPTIPHVSQNIPRNPPAPTLPEANIANDSSSEGNKEESSRTSSPSSNQSQSNNQDQNQTLKTCMSSESSSSAGDSGCPSEPPRLSPDHDYEGIPQN